MEGIFSNSLYVQHDMDVWRPEKKHVTLQLYFTMTGDLVALVRERYVIIDSQINDEQN